MYAIGDIAKARADSTAKRETRCFAWLYACCRQSAGNIEFTATSFAVASMADTGVSGREAPATRPFGLVDLDARALRGAKWLCMSGIAAVLVVASTLFFYAHPLADDFARAYKGRTQGVVSATILEYFTWTGRWASTGLDYFLTSSFDLVRLYPLLLMINPALLAGGLYLLLLAAGIGTARGQRLALTAAALALYWAGMPHPGESIYWLTGGDSTFAGLSVSLLLLAGLLRQPAPTMHGSVAIGAGLSLLTVLATGFHELFGLLVCIVLVGGALRAWLARDPRRWIWAVCVVAALVGFLVVYLAPGNAVRRAEFRLAGKLDVALRLTVTQGIRDVISWVLDIRLLMGTALLLMLAPQALTGLRPGRDGTARDVVIVALTWVVALVAAYAAGSWAIGINMPARTRNGIYLVFLAGWFWVLVMLARLIAMREHPRLGVRPLMCRVAAVIFVVAMLLTGNTWKALGDLHRTAPVYSKAMRDRWRSLEAAQARAEQDAVVEPLPARPQLYISYFELRQDPAYWENWSVAHYFGLRSVRLGGTNKENR